jgi:hypothetical protein
MSFIKENHKVIGIGCPEKEWEKPERVAESIAVNMTSFRGKRMRVPEIENDSSLVHSENSWKEIKVTRNTDRMLD